LGLAFSRINTVRPKKVDTPVESMSALPASFFLYIRVWILMGERIKQKDISQGQELFTCYLGSWRDASDLDRGELFYTFGYIDEDVVTRCSAHVHYAPIDTSRGF
jgi:hypothetical protein